MGDHEDQGAWPGMDGQIPARSRRVRHAGLDEKPGTAAFFVVNGTGLVDLLMDTPGRRDVQAAARNGLTERNHAGMPVQERARPSCDD